MISHWSGEYHVMGRDWLAARRVWQQEFARVLANRAIDSRRYEQGLLMLMNNPRFGRSAAFEQKVLQNRELLISLYLRIDASLSEKQRYHLVETLRNYAEDFEVLSRE